LNSDQLHFEAENNEANKFLEYRWLRQRHLDLQKMKENQQYKVYMHKWAVAKGQFTEELARKGESAMYGNNFEKLQFRRKPYDVEEGEDDLVYQEPPG
jgi:hypothetical protein